MSIQWLCSCKRALEQLDLEFDNYKKKVEELNSKEMIFIIYDYDSEIVGVYNDYDKATEAKKELEKVYNNKHDYFYIWEYNLNALRWPYKEAE